MNDTAATSTTLMPGLVALCQEIRNANWEGEERDGRHFWSVDLDFDLDLPLRMAAINCAICGNYQMSRTTNQQLCSPVIFCEDEEHVQYTCDVIDREDEDDDEHEHLVRTQ